MIGRLSPIREMGRDKHGRVVWLCGCSCGAQVEVRATDLRTGVTKSCGCLKAEGKKPRHGHKLQSGASRAYAAWLGMKQRCTNKKLKQWKDYGGRGITFCRRWEEFENFLADMGEPGPGMSLDREDNDRNYSKENCRWADRVTQRHNSRGPFRFVEINGQKLILAEAVKLFGVVGYMTALNRIHTGWSPVEAITTPKMR